MAWIRMSVTGGQIRLEVEDNGRGLATEDADANSGTPVSLGVGIPGMRERMREIGGSLRIQSGKHGTKVTATLSLANEQTERASAHWAHRAERPPDINVECGG